LKNCFEVGSGDRGFANAAFSVMAPERER